MSALLSNTLKFDTVKTIFTWPTKDFPNNAITTAAGIASFVALRQILKVSYYYTLMFTGVTLACAKVYQMNKEAQKRQIIDPKRTIILNKITFLDGFQKNNLPMVKQLLELGRDTIEPMFNMLNQDKFNNIKLLTEYCEIDMVEFANIWNKFPNFDDASSKNRCNLFAELLEGEYKVYFQNLK